MSNRQLATGREIATSAGSQSFTVARGITVTVSPDAKWSRSTAVMIALTFTAHPKAAETVDDVTLSAYDRILRNYPPELVEAAVAETLARVTWFPKVQEIAESARNLLTLIHSRGMYATDKAGRERRDTIRAWEYDLLEETRDFIARAKGDKELKAELSAFARRREVSA